MAPDSLSAHARDDIRELRMLFELSQLLNSTAHMEDRLSGALRLMARHMGMMRGMITLVSPDTGDIHIETAYGLNPMEQARGHYAKGEGITGKVIATGKPMVVSNVSLEPLFLNRTQSRNLHKDAVSYLCVPHIMEEQVIGARGVDRLFADKHTLEEDARVLAIVASLLAGAARVRQGLMQDSRPVSAPKPASFVGASEIMQNVYARMAQVAASNATVLLRGESGTGKELAAQAIHSMGARARQPFVSLNCAALPENLIESELFGHERGAFTGAVGMRKGRFEMAHGGTLFLDEVGELSMLTQAKLLRVLQERSFERVGGMDSIHVDVRIITATNRPLEEMVSEGLFRRDLYYRLNVFPIVLPPLRQRRGDIIPLASHFLAKYAAVNGRTGLRLSLSASEMLSRYSWPGNVRELENAMEHAVLVAGAGERILPRHLPQELHSASCPFAAHPAPPLEQNGTGTTGDAGDGGAVLLPRLEADGTLQDKLDEMERIYIIEALRRQQGHMGRAAQALGLTERVMGLRMRKYGIRYKDFRRSEQST